MNLATLTAENWFRFTGSHPHEMRRYVKKCLKSIEPSLRSESISRNIVVAYLLNRSVWICSYEIRFAYWRPIDAMAIAAEAVPSAPLRSSRCCVNVIDWISIRHMESSSRLYRTTCAPSRHSSKRCAPLSELRNWRFTDKLSENYVLGFAFSPRQDWVTALL